MKRPSLHACGGRREQGTNIVLLRSPFRIQGSRSWLSNFTLCWKCISTLPTLFILIVLFLGTLSRQHMTVLNVDGSSLGNSGRAVLGVWLKTLMEVGYMGSLAILVYPLLFMLNYGLCFRALARLWNKGHKEIICYSDSQTVITLVRNYLPHYHQYASLIRSVQDLLSRDWSVTLQHSLRGGNQCADFFS